MHYDKQFIKPLIAILLASLWGCNSGGGESNSSTSTEPVGTPVSPGTTVGGGGTGTESSVDGAYYDFFTDYTAIYAIDRNDIASNPIKVATLSKKYTDNTFKDFQFWKFYGNRVSGNSVSDVHVDAIIYVDGGKLYKIDAKIGSLPPSAIQLSNETGIIKACASMRIDSPQATQIAGLLYTMGDTSGNCLDNAVTSRKLVTLGMTSSQSPTLVNNTPPASQPRAVKDGTANTKGWLSIENGALRYYPASLQPPVTLIESGVSSMGDGISMSKYYVFSIVRVGALSSEIYSLDTDSRTLSVNLAQNIGQKCSYHFNSGSTYGYAEAGDSHDFYGTAAFCDTNIYSNKLVKLTADGKTQATLALNKMKGYYIGSAANRAIIQTDAGIESYSMDDGSSKLLLGDTSGSFSISRVGTDRVFYKSWSSGDIGSVKLDGTDNKLFHGKGVDRNIFGNSYLLNTAPRRPLLYVLNVSENGQLYAIDAASGNQVGVQDGWSVSGTSSAYSAPSFSRLMRTNIIGSKSASDRYGALVIANPKQLSSARTLSVFGVWLTGESTWEGDSYNLY